jgi:ABC-2 type transport system permease protein
MRRVLLIAKRDYLAAVRAKAFLIGLIVAPILFGGGFIGLSVMKKKPDLADRKIAVLDLSGKAVAPIAETVAAKQAKEKQKGPRYLIEPATGDRLNLSDRVRRKEYYAFLVIPATGETAEYYTNASGIDESRGWLSGPIADGIRRARLVEAGVAAGQIPELLAPTTVQSMSLLTRDTAKPKKRDEVEVIMVPLATMMLLCMIVLASASPMLGAVADDKTQRVFEMLLGSATPFELMLGKVIAAVGLALTSSVFYVSAGLLVLQSMALMGLAPLTILPWFVIYLIADVMVLSSLGMALGAACGSPNEAQQLAMLVLAPVMIPMFLFMPVLQQPNGPIAVAMSFFPPFTPILMMLRQTLPGGVPAWQPWVALLGVVVWTLGMSWAASRVFRVVILVQGKLPKFGQLVRWAIQG